MSVMDIVVQTRIGYLKSLVHSDMMGTTLKAHMLQVPVESPAVAGTSDMKETEVCLSHKLSFSYISLVVHLHDLYPCGIVIK